MTAHRRRPRDQTRTRTKQPTPYRVLMLNDDYTPMEFVVLCLQRFFRMDMEEATRVMLHVHQKGVGVCGIFSYEVAETKVGQVHRFRARRTSIRCNARSRRRDRATVPGDRRWCGPFGNRIVIVARLAPRRAR